MTKQDRSNCAILVLSCDKYSDLWKPFFFLFHKYWPKCPFRVYLGSNTKAYSDKTISTILSKSSIDWSTDLLSILQNIKEENIFIWLEDLFPTDMINTEMFVRCFEFMKENQASHIHISPAVHPDGICDNTFFGFYEKGAPYRVTVPGFWNKKILQQLLLPGENPWKFEIMGSYRSSYSDRYFCINIPLFQFIRAVDKGTISREAYEYCQNNNIKLDTNSRRVFSLYDRIKSNILGYVFQAVMKVHWKNRVKIMEILRRILVSY